MKASGISIGEWRAAFDESAAMCADKVPEGWLSAAELAKMFKRHTVYIQRALKPMLLDGRAMVRTYRVLGPSGRLKVVPHYKLKNRKEHAR